MRIAYLDCFSGISGDMFLGALVDAGVSPKILEDTVAALDIGAHLEISRVVRSGIAATKVDMHAHGEKDSPREVESSPRDHTHSHDKHDHAHDHSHDGSHQHAHSHDHESHSHSHGRGLNEIRVIIQKASISATAKVTAVRIFEALGAAEAEIHNTSIDKVHFHEVGAVDAMVDIVCAAVGAESLAIDEWICSPLNVGSGTVKCAHGTLPVPAPATLKLLKDAPVYSSGPTVELVTPTGAAILRTLVTRFASFPSMTVAQAGYGAGTRDFPQHPNVLRLTIGTSTQDVHLTSETISVLEANLDDLSPQVLAYASEKLLSDGALDVFSIPVQMKKGRAGSLLTVLCKPGDTDRLTKLIFAETSTLGVRSREEHRQTLARRWETVKTSWGDVRIKIASMNGSISNYAPEYEDCRALAEANQVPLKAVIEEAMRQYKSR
ncbi:MAG: nickel pincer cofactor biosynthesis protein LarC [Acidobacteria bacterium]|nr:nickel pincer cofactor biosynthesis protein LarC [Acidobacteriota bacterium]